MKLATTALGLALAAWGAAAAEPAIREARVTAPDGVSLYVRAVGTEGPVVLAPFATLHGTQLDRLGGSARLVLFVPPRVGPWLDRVCAVVARRRSIEVIVGTDGVGRGARSPWTRLTRRTATLEAPRASELDEILSRLAALRVRATLVDRSPGRVFGPAHQRALKVA